MFNKNLFNAHFDDQVKIIEAKANAGSVANNYFYNVNTGLAIETYMSITTENAKNLEYAKPESLTHSPLAQGWDPANGKFVSYIITPSSGLAPSVLVGAQRAGMSGLPADVNSPSNDYTDNNHGTISEN